MYTILSTSPVYNGHKKFKNLDVTDNVEYLSWSLPLLYYYR